MNKPMTLKATYKLHNVKIDTPVSISNFMLEPIPEYPNDTYLRFEFTHRPQAGPCQESEKEVELFSLVFSMLYGAGSPKFEGIVDRSGRPIVEVADPRPRNPITLEQMDFDKIEKTYKKVQSMSSPKKEIFDFVSRWTQKANDAYYVYERFIFHWIAFNFLYGRMPAQGERNKIEGWVNKYCKDPYPSEFFADFQHKKYESSQRKAIEDLAKANLELRGPPKNVSVQLKQRIKHGQFDLETLKYLVLCIYAVRNNLFHADWSYLDERKGHVGSALFLLCKLLRRGLQKQCDFPF